MHKQFLLCVIAALPLLLAADWPQFRGVGQQSVAESSKPPLEWSDDKNVAWKAPLVGRGVSSPIVVGGKAIVTASSWPKQDRLYVLAFDVKTGKELWRRAFWATGWTFTHTVSANAAPTPASDGKHVVAFWSSNDLACLDLDGNLKWFRGLASDYPNTRNDVGMSSSPLIAGDTVVVQMENQADSWAGGIDIATGEDRWRVDRPRENAWTTPALFQSGKQALVLLQSIKYLTAHDAATGREVWKYTANCGGIPSTTVAGNGIYLPANGITKLTLSGNEPIVDWDSNRINPGNSSPVIYDGNVYIISRAGVLSCADTAKGAQLWQTRLKGTFWSTPVIANGHLFAVNQDGQTLVVKLGEKGEIVATNEIKDQVLASPAIADDAFYLRSDKFLWKIAAP